MLWTEDDAFLEKLERLPKMYMGHTAYERIHRRIREEEAQLQQRNRRIKRIRLITMVSLPLVILILITSFLATDFGRDQARNAWSQLHGNILELEDGVVAEFRGHKVTMQEIKDQKKYVLGSNEDILLIKLKQFMVYEEALTKGFVLDPNTTEDDAEFQLMMQYLEHLIGNPHVVGGYEFKSAMSQYLDLSFERYKHEVLFNKKYEDQFNWRRIIDQGGKTANLPDSVFAAFRGKQILTKYTPEFVPDKMTLDQVQNKLAYEFLYQEALEKGHVPAYNPNAEHLKLKARYEVDPALRETIQKEMAEKGLKETDYWEQLRQIEQKNSVIRRYMLILYPTIIGLGEEDFGKVIDLIGEERLKRYKDEIVINEKFAAQYKWSAEKILDISAGDMPSYVVAKYRDREVIAFGLGKDRFHRKVIDGMIDAWIVADIAREKGYTVDRSEIDQFVERDKRILFGSQESIDRELAFYEKITAMTEEQLWQYYLDYAEARLLAVQFAMDTLSPLQEPGLQMLDFTQFREVYKEYYDDVVYNPRYPLVEH